MKKAILTIICTLILTTIYAQEIELIESKFKYEKIEVIDSLSANQIYLKSHEWIARSFYNTESVIQADIKDKMIRINGISTDVVKGGMYILDLKYLILFEFKDNKVRISVNAFELIWSGGEMTLEYACLKKSGDFRKGKVYENYYDSANKKIKSLIQNYIYSFHKEYVDDDW